MDLEAKIEEIISSYEKHTDLSVQDYLLIRKQAIDEAMILPKSKGQKTKTSKVENIYLEASQLKERASDKEIKSFSKPVTTLLENIDTNISNIIVLSQKKRKG